MVVLRVQVGTVPAAAHLTHPASAGTYGVPGLLVGSGAAPPAAHRRPAHHARSTNCGWHATTRWSVSHRMSYSHTAPPLPRTTVMTTPVSPDGSMRTRVPWRSLRITPPGPSSRDTAAAPRSSGPSSGAVRGCGGTRTAATADAHPTSARGAGSRSRASGTGGAAGHGTSATAGDADATRRWPA